jgi:hypothetical protein
MTRIVKATTVALLSAAIAVVGLPLGGSAVVAGSTGCCRTAL